MPRVAECFICGRLAESFETLPGFVKREHKPRDLYDCGCVPSHDRRMEACDVRPA